MSKYIDAEQLRAEIERRKDEWQALINKNNAVNPTAVKEVICEDLNILDTITSLQQEMELPDKYQTPDWIWEDKTVDSLQQEQPVSGSSEKPNNLLSEKQEQPEVDLEKILNSPVQSTWHIIDGKMTLVKRYSDEQVIQAYELGKLSNKK